MKAAIKKHFLKISIGFFVLSFVFDFILYDEVNWIRNFILAAIVGLILSIATVNSEKKEG